MKYWKQRIISQIMAVILTVSVIGGGTPVFAEEASVDSAIVATEITLNTSSYTGTVGSSIQLTATVLPEDGQAELTWVSSDPSSVSVSDTGLVEILKYTETPVIVTATTGELTASCTITIQQEESEPVTLQVSPASKTLTTGEVYKITVSVTPSDTTVMYNSSDEAVATVSSDGTITAVSPGTAEIVVTAGDQTAVCKVTVKAPTVAVTGIKLNKSTLSIVQGKTYTLKATITPSDATDKTVTYSSSNKSVATVSQSGKITAIKAGTATITAKASNGEKATCKVTVKAPTVAVTGIKLNKSTLSIVQGKTYTLKATITPSNATDKTVTYSSSNKSVATVSQSGKITAKKPGTVTITAKSANGKKSTCKVTVKLSAPSVKASAYLTSVKLSWKEVPNSSGYYVYRATSKNGKYSKIKTLKGSDETSYKNTNLKPGKTYYYKVIAYGKDSKYNSASSKIISAKTALKTPVMETTASVKSSSIKITWNKSSEAQGYYIYRRSNKNESWKMIAKVKGASTLSYTDKTAKGTYYYAVASYRVLDGRTYKSAKSEAIRVRVLKKTIITVKQAGDELKNKVSWSKVKGATGYQVYYKVGANGSWKKAATVGNVTSYTMKVTHGKYYYYKVRPIAKLDGAYSIGEFSNVDNLMLYYSPNVSFLMSSKTDSSCGVVVIYIKNNGVSTLRVYAKNALLIDNDSDLFNRNLIMHDYEEFQNGRLTEVSYVDIKAGESTYLLFDVVGSDTWYDKKSTVAVQFKYDGVKYVGLFSNYYGFYYDEMD